MKPSLESILRGSLAVCAALATTVALVRDAAANDAGGDAAAVADAGGADGDTVNDDGGGGTGSTSPAIACDGALCDTTNDSACSAAPGIGGRFDGATFGASLSVMGMLLVWRRRRRPSPRAIRKGARMMMMGSVIVSAACATKVAAAQQPQPSAVDVRVSEPPSPERTLVVSVEPLPIVALGKWSANVVFAPVKHHAISVTPFYASTSTVPVYVFNDASIQSGQASAQLPKQRFEGFGAELGYRYYFGSDGPRGVFLSPSLLLGSFTATAADTTQTGFWNLGLAADAGYEALVADRFAITLGAGLQGTITTKSIPNQQFPAELYANGGLRPRLLLAFGWAF